MRARIEFDVSDLRGMSPEDIEDVLECMVRDGGLSAFLRGRAVDLIGAATPDAVTAALDGIERNRVRLVELDTQNAELVALMTETARATEAHEQALVDLERRVAEGQRQLALLEVQERPVVH
ncbi:hypothetical protein [Azospirillum canadense]|uniref:hypothetical protein n=1 Tax=Azospirillum canadense TaxID=403962 RepID=UPI002226D16D|nr:hypothetical protein [Azospirillum canadense]MCW2237469.1 hypothetical protein [Azospirillum canadense]